MKLHVLSDLHLEFEPFEFPRTEADAIVLAGDIAPKLGAMKMLVGWCPDKPVVFVAGNHEYYGASLPLWIAKFKEYAEGTNIRFLENDQAILPGVRFLGCTLWTDFGLFGEEEREESMEVAEQLMNDYEKILKSPEFRKLSPKDTLVLHKQSVRWLSQKLEETFDGLTVVVTHHPPSARSLRDGAMASSLAPAIASDVEFLLGGDRVQLWVHGHTHHCVDYALDGTRVVSNQRGYPHEPVGGFKAEFVVEI